ncbi:m12 protein [Murid betaherpesvirus 1]|nr:m12 protein [Murid betaherpesvirus 1]
MFRRYPTGVFTTVTLLLAALSPTLFVLNVSFAEDFPCNTDISAIPGSCTNLRMAYRQTNSNHTLELLKQKKKKKNMVLELSFSCITQTINYCVNATWTGRWFTINTAEEMRKRGEQETTIGYVFFTSTSSSPPTFSGTTIVEPKPFQDLWINSTTGDLHVLSNSSASPIKCNITLCFGASTPLPPRRQTITPFRSTDDHSENLETPASRRTIDNGTIAAIVLMSAIVVGLIILAALYRRRRFDRFK